VAAQLLPKVTSAAADVRSAATTSAAPGPALTLPRWRPSSSDLQPFEGRYLSDEAGAAYRATLEQGRLVLRLQGRAAPALALSPTHQDIFVFSGGRVRFSRSDGRIDGLSMDVQRAHGLRFERAPGPP
jgi:hypothetical protein